MTKKPRKPRKGKTQAPPAAPEEQEETQDAAASNGIGHNQPPPTLTDDQLAVLFFMHKDKYEAALATKKAAEAAFKNACKLARAELGDDAIDAIKDSILLDTEEGEQKIQAQIERQQRVARWMAIPLFAQTDFFAEPDLTPAVDRAEAEGKRDGQAGKPLNPPYDKSVPQFDAYATGWYAGQKALFSIKRGEDGALFDQAEDAEAPPPVGDEEANYETAS